MTIYSIEPVAVELPQTAKTMDGAKFYPHDTVWVLPSLSRSVVFNWERLEPFLNTDLINIAKCGVIKCFENDVATRTTADAFSMLVNCAKANYNNDTGLIGKITEAHIRVYREMCRTTGGWHESDVTKLNILLGRWHDLKLPGIDPKVATYLKRIRLKKRATGVAVRVNDPEEGIFTDLERKRISAAMRSAFCDGIISVEDFAMYMLCELFGQRPVQFGALKHKDLHIQPTSDGSREYRLDIPLGKGRGNQSICNREEFLYKHLPKEAGEIMVLQIMAVREKYHEKGVDTVPLEELPIFAAWEKQRNGFGWLPGFLYHSSGKVFSRKLKGALDKLDLISEETAKKLRVTPGRFRHTIASHLKAQGKSDVEICIIMGWREKNSAAPYSEVTPQLVKNMEKIDDVLAFAPFIQAFKGKFIGRKDTRKNAIRLRKTIDDIPSNKPGDIVDLGGCDKDDFCGMFIPYACYTCDDFQPWDEVEPHLEFYRFLTALRDDKLQRNDNGQALLSENHIATVHDLTICACAQVVSMCMKEQEANS